MTQPVLSKGIYSAKAKRYYLTADLPAELQQLWTDARHWRSVKGNEKVWWRLSSGASLTFTITPPKGAEICGGDYTFKASKNTMLACWQRLKAKTKPAVIPPAATTAPLPANTTVNQGQPVAFGHNPNTPHSGLILGEVPAPTPALDAARKHNLIGPRVSGTEYMCLCPWRAEHKTGGQQNGIHDQSTQVGPNSFHCRHGSCQGKRYVAEFLTALNPPEAPKVNTATQVILVIDNSVSMTEGNKHAAARRQIQLICDQLRSNMPQWAVKVLFFGYDVSTAFAGEAKLLPMLHERYHPDEGATRLYDAVGTAAVAALGVSIPSLIYLITDGEPTGYTMTAIASHRSIAAARVKEALDSKRVTMICVGPPTATAFFESCGIPGGVDGCIRSWDGYDAKDLDKITGQVSEGLKSYAAAREAGETQIKKFFVDGRKLEARLHELIDITALCKVLRVDRECVLQPFVEDSGHKFVPGANFYPLTKKETLRPNRAILVRPKNRNGVNGGAFGHVFSGPNVREVLGLPADREVTVEPGDMGNLELFLESSSHNRLLVRGTDLIVRLDVQPQAHTWVKPQSQMN